MNETAWFTLENYLSALNRPLGSGEVIALFTPVIELLNEWHAEGYMYLKLSRESIVVTQEGMTLREVESDATVCEFSAPELLLSDSGDVRSDTYSLCAAMRFVLAHGTLKPSEDMLKVLDKGMATEPESRYQSIDELTAALMPYAQAVDMNSLMMPFAAAQQPVSAPDTPDVQSTVKESAPVHDTQHVRLIEQERAPVMDTPHIPWVEPGSALPPQHYTPAVNAGASAAQKIEPKKILGLKLPAFIGIAVAAVLLIAAAIVFISNAANYSKAIESMDKGDFIEAQNYMKKVINAEEEYPDEYRYINSGAYMERGDCGIAIPGFEKLGDFKDSELLLQECRYLYANVNVSSGNYSMAIELYNQVPGYKDADIKAMNAAIAYAEELVAEEDYDSAFVALSSIVNEDHPEAVLERCKIYYIMGMEYYSERDYVAAFDMLINANGYGGSQEIIEQMKTELYYTAVEAYRGGEYASAYDLFTALGDVNSSMKYVTLCEAYLATELSNDMVDSLKPLIGFEDAGNLIMSSNDSAVYFLTGEWKERYGSKYLTVGEDGYASYSVPWIDYGDLYTIENSMLYVYYSGDYDNKKAMWEIYLLDEDTISIYAFKDGNTYTLRRQ